MFKLKTNQSGVGLRVLVMSAIMFLASVTAYALQMEDANKLGKANKEYRDGNFKSAAQLYQELTETYPHVGMFYYNLGNSLYRQGALGTAILAYQRAQLFEPRDRDIKHNLDYVQSLLEYRVEDKRNWYLKITELILKRFTEEEVGFLLMATFFLFMTSWVYVLYFRRGLPWGAFRKTLLVLLILFAGLAAAKSVETRIFRDAVVMDNDAEVRFGPSSGDQVAFRLGEGLRVYVMDKRKAWSRILIVNGESGWIQNSAIAEVRI